MVGIITALAAATVGEALGLTAVGGTAAYVGKKILDNSTPASILEVRQKAAKEEKEIKEAEEKKVKAEKKAKAQEARTTAFVVASLKDNPSAAKELLSSLFGFGRNSD